MARMRKLSAALFLVPMTLAAGPTAHAAPRGVAITGATPLLGAGMLTPGVHARRDGRYTVDNCDHSKSHYCFSKTLLPSEWQPGQPIPSRVREGGGGGGLTPGGMGPSDVITAYQIPSNANANGKIVAILDSADSFAYSDLTEYRATYGLPALPKCSGLPTGTSPCFAQVSQSGGASSGQDSGQDGDAETSLDMDMVSAACPDCSILLVEIGDTQGDFSDNDFVEGAQTAANLGAVAISISIGGPEGAGATGQGGQDPTGYTTAGHLVLAASGDFGYDLIDEGANIGTPSYPASAPDVLAVGGTTLFSSGSSYDEAVWNDGTFATNQNGQDVTTSGCSTEFGALSWQTASLSGTGCANRATADVSAAAAFVSGGQLADIAVYVQGWTAVEGTSASSPLMAGMLTRLGLAEIISNNLGWPYSNPTGWNDLGSTAYPVDSSGSSTDSNKPSSCGKLCSVATGWDGPSGLGTPNGAILASLAGLPQPPPGVDAGSPSSGTGAGGTGTGTGGTGTLPGSGSQPMGTAADPGSLGATCDGPSDCESTLCARPAAGQAAVCTAPCSTTGTACLIGFACTEGYCFPGVTFTGASTQNNNNNNSDGDSGGSGSSGGCAVSSETGSSWAGLGWLSVGLFAVARRRRQLRAS